MELEIDPGSLTKELCRYLLHSPIQHSFVTLLYCSGFFSCSSGYSVRVLGGTFLKIFGVPPCAYNFSLFLPLTLYYTSLDPSC